MADKKVVLIVCGEADVNGGAALKKYIKKSCTFAGFDAANMVAEAAKIQGGATVAANGVARVFEEDGALAIVELGDVTAEALEASMAQIAEAADRRTLIVLATASGLFMGGLGMNKKAGTIQRNVVAADVIATICYVADLPIPGDCTGAVLYQALKDPDMKLKEMRKLKEAIGRMEVALQRDNREPWDKHDCA
ncbi:hypothetical protein [Desulfoplanes formicivorans]|uniref:Uncharacterized protein n=1 Tax=Desulfoplanes formicivorans TaxID=1592317 RepID=A0A194AF22_9BACT|nr:hypothetical protein [Desulfoplanes formicivorans]GAU07795.1 hypothetical protein DPF_0494 [Desulfoplanes formicivorans]